MSIIPAPRISPRSAASPSSRTAAISVLAAAQTVNPRPFPQFLHFAHEQVHHHPLLFSQEQDIRFKMGWLKALHNIVNDAAPESVKSRDGEDVKRNLNTTCASHIEEIHVLDQPRCLPFAHPDTADSRLPFLSAAEVAIISEGHNNNSASRLYIVVDEIVYDCTQFLHDHPGGPRVIENFRGQDCSWQFWRFHSKENLRVWGRHLRVARTSGVKNRWKERPRFVGLRGLGAAAEDYTW
ncbi:hypothetical protein yc1106_01913 [Curvularia clavata]|uniref:Cytochrome b5 heme-binding domain-containing protein n=1 Tax=Curvularia clavata TaxID=95742 RepID=A0A9Q8Z293_CURCL|nr:hypothetical protein yc1106_01913 [Curvularia clavata]